MFASIFTSACSVEAECDAVAFCLGYAFLFVFDVLPSPFRLQVPSHLWEHFVTDPRTLRTLARHRSSGDPLPLPLCAALTASNRAVAHLSLQNAALLAAVDQAYFGPQQPASGRTSEIWHELSGRFAAVRSLPGTHPQVGFLVHYSWRYWRGSIPVPIVTPLRLRPACAGRLQFAVSTSRCSRLASPSCSRGPCWLLFVYIRAGANAARYRFVVLRCTQARLNHLTVYGATYYSYLYARCLASGIWKAHLAGDPFSSEAGDRIRSLLLAPGGTRPPAAVVQSLLGPQALQGVDGGWAPRPEDLVADYSEMGE